MDIFRGRMPVRRLPKLDSIGSLTHRKLVDCLRQCPESKYFNILPAVLNTDTLKKRHARKLVYDMVSSAITLTIFDTVEEADSILEASRRLSQRIPSQNLLGKAF